MQKLPDFRELFRPAPDALLCLQGPQHMRRAWRMAAVNLAWSFWIPSVPLLSGAAWRDWVPMTVLSYVVFLGLYVRAYTVPARGLWLYMLAMTALGCILSPFNWGGMTYVIYACVFAGYVFRRIWSSMLAMLVILAMFAIECWLLKWSWENICSLGLWALVVGGMNLMYRAKGRADAQLRLSHDEVRRLAASAERERIGRDLHDLLGHTLSLVALKSELAGRLIERDPRAARREIADVERVARDALAQVRSAVSGIRAAALASELASARLLLETTGVRMTYRLDCGDLPNDIETCLALVLREAVTNIERHAHAGCVETSVEHAVGEVRMRVHDNGRGGVSSCGNGLTGMRERVQALDGKLAIDSPRGKGTTIEVKLPVHTSKKETVPRAVPQTPATPVAQALTHAGSHA
jgi:two-component system, NarL family, sensor histidine kinase DesK